MPQKKKIRSRRTANAASEAVKRTAYHESGHAVLAVYFRHGVSEVTIVADDEKDYLGGAWHPSPMMLGAQTKPEMRECVEECVIIAFGGYQAEVRFDPKADESLAEDDYVGAKDLPRLHAASLPKNYPPRNQDAYFRKMKRRAGQMVTELWPAVNSLAKTLLRRKHLTGEQVEKIVKPFCEEH